MAKPNSELFDQYVTKVYSLCRRYAHDSPTAKDYLQECFLHIYENIHKYDINKGKLDGWIFRVSTNVILKQIEKSKKIRFTEILDTNVAEESNEAQEQIDPALLFTCLDKLPEGYKQVLSLYVLENKSHKEIADKLNISESTSRSQLLRAKNYLKNSVLNSTYERG